MEDYKCCSIQGRMGMEVLGTNVWSRKIEVERGGDEGKRRR
jgi:hypothetical protein